MSAGQIAPSCPFESVLVGAITRHSSSCNLSTVCDVDQVRQAATASDAVTAAGHPLVP